MAMTSESGRIQRPLSGDDVAELHAEFAACDADGDGRVGYAEFASLLQSVGTHLSDEKRRAEFSRIDTDANGLIDLAEFKQWWQGG